MRRYIRLFVGVCAVPLGAMAQPSVDSRPAASDAPAKVTGPPYRSVFSDYRGLTDDKVDWKEANDLVRRIGGWRAYLRESQRSDTPAERSTQQPQADTAKPTTKPSTPTAGTHGAHKH